MNKKSILLFLGGVATSGLVFAAILMVSSHKETPPVSLAPLPAIAEAAPVSAPALLSEPAQAASIPAPASTPKTAAAVPASIDSSVLKETLLNKLAAHSVIHEVKPKDTLTSISKKYLVTVSLIRQMNGMTNDKLLLGQKLKIPNYHFSVVVDKSQNNLILKGDEEVLKQYLVSTGANNSTPVGVFKITDKLQNPTWYKDGKAIPFGDARNVLGTRWMGFTKKSYGIHGTVEPEKLGQQVTDGCVRMKNEDVEELFEVLPSGAEVTIVD